MILMIHLILILNNYINFVLIEIFYAENFLFAQFCFLAQEFFLFSSTYLEGLGTEDNFFKIVY